MGIENNIRTFFNLDAMNSFSTFCQGESHILIDKVCQDYALDESKKGVSIAIVCDGHGGERAHLSHAYCRASRGDQHLLPRQSPCGEGVVRLRGKDAAAKRLP